MGNVKMYLWNWKFGLSFHIKNIRKIFNLLNHNIKLVNYAASKEVLFDNIYFKYKEFLPSGDGIVFDIGSQYGDYAIACNKLYGSKPVIAFEPLQRNYRIAKRNIKLSKAGDSVFLSDCAISDCEILGMSNNSMLTNLDLYGKWFKPDFILLDNLVKGLERNYIIKIDIIKIDVEGFEMHVLESAINTIKKYKPKIIIETHNYRLFDLVFNFLGELGYDLVYSDYNGYSNIFDYVVNNFFLPI